MEDEMDQLRTTRDEAQRRVDRLDIMLLTPRNIEAAAVNVKMKKSSARQKRALRWFGRFAALGTGVVASVLTGGTMAPVALFMLAAVEATCQSQENRGGGAQGEDNRVGLCMGNVKCYLMRKSNPHFLSPRFPPAPFEATLPDG